APHEAAGRARARELLAHRRPVLLERLDVERGGDPLLAAEVVVDAADARVRPRADVLDGGRVVAELLEAGERRLEDRLLALRGPFPAPRHRSASPAEARRPLLEERG